MAAGDIGMERPLVATARVTWAEPLSVGMVARKDVTANQKYR